MSKKYLAIAWAAASVSTAVATPLPAPSLLRNGGFETSDFTGWTLSGNANYFTNVLNQPYDGYAAHGGANYALLGPVGADGMLSQTFADEPGQALDVTFYVATDGGQTSDFTAQLDGATLAALTNPAAQGWTRYDAVVTGTGSDTLQFGFRDDPGYMALDDVSVTPLAVPEPAALSMLAVGLAAVLGLRRRWYRLDRNY